MRSQERFFSIDVADVMKKLTGCGKLIQYAYINSNGAKCQKEVIVLQSNYADLVKDSYNGCCVFVSNSIQALDYHKIAYDVLAKSPSAAITFISKCSDLAGAMAFLAQELVGKAEVLRDQATKAMRVAVEDKTDDINEQKRIQQMMDEAKAEQAKLDSVIKEAAEEEKDLKQQEAAAIKRAEAASEGPSFGAVLGQIASSMTGVGLVTTIVKAAAKGGDEKENGGSSAEDTVQKLAQLRHDNKKMQIEANAKLQETIMKLANSEKNASVIVKALMAIELVIKALGKIKTIFANVAAFWMGVKDSCNNLVVIGDKLKTFKGEANLFVQQILDEIVNSALGWFTLLKINYEAKQIMIQCDKEMDNMLENIPNESEASEMVQALAQEMNADLAEESKKLELENSEVDEKQEKPLTVFKRPKDDKE
jgi:hypothetical protein